MNNEKKLEVLRELTKLAIATPTSGRPGQPIDTTNKPQVQANQDAVALTTMPAASRPITVKSPASKNTALAGAMKTKGITAAKPGKQNTAKFGTNMKMASVDQKELLKQRLMESYIEKRAIAFLPFLAGAGKAALGWGARTAVPWIARTIFRRGAQRAAQRAAGNQLRKNIAKRSLTEAQRLKNVTTPAQRTKNFFKGVKEGIKPGKSGKALRESGKAQREALKQSRQAADDIVGGTGKTPKLFRWRNQRVHNNKLPNKLKDQIVRRKGDNAYIRNKPGAHISRKTMQRGVKPQRNMGPLQKNAPQYVNKGYKATYQAPRTRAAKDFAQKAYAQSQSNIRAGELANTVGRGVGIATRHAGKSVAVGAGLGSLAGGGAGAYKYYDAATKANKPLNFTDGLKATASGAYEGTGIPFVAGQAGFMSKARKDAGNPLYATPTTDVSIKNTVANTPGKVDKTVSGMYKGDVQAANQAAARVNPKNPVLYDSQFRPLSGTPLKKAQEAMRKKTTDDLGRRGFQTFQRLRQNALQRNQQNLNNAVQN